MARNQYRKPCYVCGLMVEVGAGHFERHDHSWRTEHANHPGDGRVTCEMARKATAAELNAARDAALKEIGA